MTCEGYQARLIQGYLGGNDYYKLLGKVSKSMCAKWKQVLVEGRLPKGLHRHCKFTTSNLPYAYHNYKEKCLKVSGGLQCQKPHSHEREIISEALNPVKGHLRLVARAIRLVRKIW